MSASTLTRMYGLTYANAEAMAKMLNGGTVGFAPLQKYKMGAPANPNRRPLVHCLADHMHTKHGEAACAQYLPGYETRSRKAREYIQQRTAEAAGDTSATARMAHNEAAARREREAADAERVAEAYRAATTATDTMETDTEMETEMDNSGGLDAMIRNIIRAESIRAARNGTAGTNAEEVARISQTLIDAAIEKAKLPTVTNIVIHRADTTGRVETENMGVQHDQFPRLLALVQNRIAGPTSRRVNVYLPGPAGSGKSTAAKHVAKALGLKYYETGAIMDETKIFGFINATGNYMGTDFFKAYTEGGVFLWDEADASDPMVSNMLNGCVDSTLASFPHGMFERHADFVFIAAANTFGMGANERYVGRNRLDAATLDRFMKLAWSYSPQLEQLVVADTYAYDTMVRIRTAVDAAGYDVVISTRAGMRHRMLRTMPDLYTASEALECAYRDGMNADQWRQVAAKAGFNVGTVRELAA